MFRPIILFALLAYLQSSGCTLPTDKPPEGYPISDLNKATRVIHFNVGQADAMLLVHRGKSVLFDCGSPLEDPERVMKVIESTHLPHRQATYRLCCHLTLSPRSPR